MPPAMSTAKRTPAIADATAPAAGGRVDRHVPSWAPHHAIAKPAQHGAWPAGDTLLTDPVGVYRPQPPIAARVVNGSRSRS
jgi:hypothetical protein